jgi:hypothetical protein
MQPNQTVNAENAPAAIFSVQVLKEKDSIYTILSGRSRLPLRWVALTINQGVFL